YGVRKYLLNSKTAEVRNAVGQMAKDAKAAFERESMAATVLAAGGVAGVSHNLCSDASQTVPAGQGGLAGQRYQAAPAEWSADASTAGKGFSCLRFSISDPQYFMYDYKGSVGTAGTFMATGMGDLNGDGVTSTFSIRGEVTSGTVFVAPTFAEDKPE